MSDSPDQPNGTNNENQTVDQGPSSPLLRSVAIAAHVWRNHFSPMSLPFFKRKQEAQNTQQKQPEAGVVHRNIARVDLLWVLLFFCSIFFWASLPTSITRVIRPIQYVEPDILDSRQLARLMVDSEQPFFSNLFQKLPLPSQLRWRETAEGSQDVSKSEIASELNGLLSQPNLLASDVVSRTISFDSSAIQKAPNEIAGGLEPFARVLYNRLLIDKHANGCIQSIKSSKLNAYQNNCNRLWGLQMVLLFVAGYRVFDLFVVGISNSPMGLSGVTPKKRTPELNKRLILTTFMGFIELVFWNGILLFGLELLGYGQFKESFFSNDAILNAPVHALQTAMSTITTIGYGTYAPNCWLTTILCFLETLTGVVLLTLVVSSVIGVANQDVSSPMAKAILASEEKWTWIIGFTVASVLLLFLPITVALTVVTLLFSNG